MNTAFAHLYQCEYRFSDSQLRLLALAEQYVNETEAYDRTVCTGPVLRDGIMPATRHEFALVNRNARQVLEQINTQNPEFSVHQIRTAASRIDSRGRSI
ncbi:hypothetical protein AAGV37_18885 [Pseudomonas protegens]|uniref:hypothetical protein n=1 Tax=Pseudomonas protegens TaxID=380021 RepID=UPI0031587D21